MSSILVIMDSVLDGESQMSRTRLIGWTAFGVCLLGYGGFAAIMIAYKLGHLELRETLLYGGPVAVVGEIGLWVAACSTCRLGGRVGDSLGGQARGVKPRGACARTSGRTGPCAA